MSDMIAEAKFLVEIHTYIADRIGHEFVGGRRV